MPIYTANFEKGIRGNDILATDAGSDAAWSQVWGNSGTKIYDDEHVAYGTLAAKIAGDGLAVNGFSWTAILPITHYGRFCVYLTESDTDIIYGYNGELSEKCWNIDVSSVHGGFLRSVDGPNGFQVGSVVVPLNKFIRIEYKIIQSTTTGVVEAKLFNQFDSDTPDDIITFSNCNTRSGTEKLFFGTTQAVPNNPSPYWLDNIIGGATSYPGPITPTSTKSISLRKTSSGLRW